MKFSTIFTLGATIFGTVDVEAGRSHDLVVRVSPGQR